MTLFFTEYKLIKTNVTEHLVKTDKLECEWLQDLFYAYKKAFSIGL